MIGCRIIIDRAGLKRWRFTIEDAHGCVLDYSFARTRGMVWRLARLSWRQLRRERQA